MRFGPASLFLVTAIGAFVPVGAPQEPVFRSGVDLVTVDVSVLGRDGRPAADLGPDDFEVKVDGRPRPVVSAQFVSRQQRGGPNAPILPRHYTSNEARDSGQVVVVAVDEAHIRRTEGRRALGAAARFVERLDPADHVAVAPLSRAGVLRFTRDRAAVKQQLDALTGHTDPVFLQYNLGLIEAVEIADGARTRLADAVLRECGRSLADYVALGRAVDDAAGRDACPEQLEQEARAVAQHARTQARISLGGLTSLVAALKPLPGPKTVVLLSEGMVLDPRLVDLGEFAALAHTARVVVYVLQMEVPTFEAAQDRVSPTLFGDRDLRENGLHRLAGAARGKVFRLVGSDPRPFDRILTEISGYYLLAFEATDADRDDRVHQIDVVVKRGAREVHARPLFRLPAVAASPRSREESLVGLLRGPDTATELPVRLATYTYAEPGSARIRLVISVEADAAQGPASTVLIGYVLTSSSDVVAVSGAQSVPSGRRSFSVTLEPGTYRLRVAGIDPLGRAGVVERVVTANLGVHDAVRVGDLLLARASADATLPLDPFIDRITESRVLAYVEMYAAPRDDAETGPRVTISVAREGSKQAQRTVSADVLCQKDGLMVARAAVALDGLTRGRYLASARIALAGGREYEVQRPFTYDPGEP